MNLDTNFMHKIRPWFLENQHRLGRNHDGGYVVPKVLTDSTNSLFSFGYGNDASFEFDFLALDKTNRVFLYDDKASWKSVSFNTVTSIWRRIILRDRSAAPRASINYLLRFLSLKLRPRLHYQNRSLVPNSSRDRLGISLNDAVKLTRSYILKLDIEESEYSVFQEINHLPILPAGILVEFHNINLRLSEFYKILDEITKNYIISNCHLNNFAQVQGGIPDVIEIVLLNRTLLGNNLPNNKVSSLPHVLDQRNSVRFPEINFQY